MWEQLANGFAVSVEPANLLACAVGVTLGTLIGVLPGIGPAAGIAMLLPVTSMVSPAAGLIMLAGIYYSSQYGGSTTAILLNMPGEVASVVTTLDGYALAKQGRAGWALCVAAVSSFVAGTLGLIGLTFFLPPLAQLAFAFGPPEYFMLTVFALTAVVNLSGGSLTKGIISGVLGLLATMIGLDPVTGAQRFTFGYPALMNGVNMVVAAIGLFALGEVLFNAEVEMQAVSMEKIGSLWPPARELFATGPAMIRSTLVGFFGGLIPGISPSVTSFVAYDIEKRACGSPASFGQGDMRGVAAPEGANNAATSGGFVPLMAFGIPPSPALAVLLAAFYMYGLQPGPVMLERQPEVAWGLIASMYVGNVLSVILNLPMVPLWARVVRVPYVILAPVIVVLSLVGAYSMRNSSFDVVVAFVFGFVGYALKRLEVPLAPMVLGLILGDQLESTFRRSMVLSDGSFGIFVSRPISLTLVAVSLLFLLMSFWRRSKAKAVDA